MNVFFNRTIFIRVFMKSKQRKEEAFKVMNNFLNKLDEKDSSDLLRIINKIFK